MAAPKAPKTPLAPGFQGWTLPPEVRRAADGRGRPADAGEVAAHVQEEEETARASTSPLVPTFQTGVPPTLGP